MKNLLILIGIFLTIFLYVFWFYGKPSNQNSPIQTQSISTPQINKAQTIYDLPKDSVEFNATTLIGFDDGNKIPNLDDIRIKRAVYLINLVSAQTKETPTEIAIAVNFVSDYLEKQFGKKIARLQLLEEAKTMFAKGDKKVMNGQKTKELLSVWALLKYGN